MGRLRQDRVCVSDRLRCACLRTAVGSDPVVPSIPGLGELQCVSGTREATSMKAVPRRLLVLGGGSAGVEVAQIVRRLGGEAVLVEGAGRALPR